MSTRKLTRRQAWRIRKIQEDRLRRAGSKALRLEAAVGDHQTAPERHGLVVANYGATLDIEDESGSLWRCLTRQNLETPVAGDTVVWQSTTSQAGVVVAVAPRRSALARPGPGGTTRVLAANIDQILVVIAPQPLFSTDLVDQYLVAAETTGIHPLLLFNKADLLDGMSRKAVRTEMAVYEQAGYTVLYASTRARHGLDELTAALKDKFSVFVGQSGVGKSSLVKALLPHEQVRVGALAAEGGHGRHTTSASRLYRLPYGGAIIDSPGVRDFGLSPMPFRAIAAGFAEFGPYLGNCRFRDCRHEAEPLCALRAAVEAGKVAPRRLDSYRRLAREFASD